MNNTRLVLDGQEVVRFKADDTYNALKWLEDSNYLPTDTASVYYRGSWDFSNEDDIDFELRMYSYPMEA